MEFARFMASPVGRIVRIVAGVVMIVVGLRSVGGTGGLVLAIAGVLPLGAGLFNFCGIAPIIGAPFWGKNAQRSSTT